MVWAAAGGSGKPCLATRPAGLETARPPEPTQTLLASVVLPAVFNGVTLEAVQLLRRVKGDLLRLARKALQELQEAFHIAIVQQIDAAQLAVLVTMRLPLFRQLQLHRTQLSIPPDSRPRQCRSGQ